MKNNFLQEIFVSLALIVLLVLFLNPFGFWMPNSLLIMMIAGFIVVFALFTSFIWRETAQDEREALHRFMAGRIAYLAGAGGLVIGIIIQSLQHNLDGWLVGILGIMIFAKIIGLIYGRIKY
ncbi:MAG: hypothetical protein AAB957_01000 [Patescibacteria group bacterium]